MSVFIRSGSPFLDPCVFPWLRFPVPWKTANGHVDEFSCLFCFVPSSSLLSSAQLSAFVCGAAVTKVLNTADRVAETTEIYCLTDLEAGSPRSKPARPRSL